MSYTQKQLKEAADTLRKIDLEEARDRGYEDGYKDGYKDGNSAKFPLIEFLMVILGLVAFLGLLVSLAIMRFTS